MQFARCRLIAICAASASAVAALVASLAQPAVAQGTPAAQKVATLVGRVRDSTGAGIGNASVGISAYGLHTRTDSNGYFRFVQIPAGEAAIVVRRLGFAPANIRWHLPEAAVDSVEVQLTPMAFVLAGVDVRERNVKGKPWMEDFYRRRDLGIGTFLTRDDILQRGSSRLTDVLATVPGIRVVRTRGGQLGVRFVSAATLDRACMPMIWLDGQRAPEMEAGEVPVNEIDGIELYHGPSTTPLRFSQGHLTTCGTIVVWSRSAGF